MCVIWKKSWGATPFHLGETQSWTVSCAEPRSPFPFSQLLCTALTLRAFSVSFAHSHSLLDTLGLSQALSLSFALFFSLSRELSLSLSRRSHHFCPARRLIHGTFSASRGANLPVPKAVKWQIIENCARQTLLSLCVRSYFQRNMLNSISKDQNLCLLVEYGTVWINLGTGVGLSINNHFCLAQRNEMHWFLLMNVVKMWWRNHVHYRAYEYPNERISLIRGESPLNVTF